MWEFVDKVIYINLDERQDRRDIMKAFFEKGQIPEDKIVRFPAIKRRITQIGILSSHTAVLQLAKQNGWKNILILEDDLQWLDFQPAYNQLCDLVQQPKWDVIMLCGWYGTYEFPRIYSASNAGAYLVNESYIDTLLANRMTYLNKHKKMFYLQPSKQIFWAADVSWNSAMSKDTWFCLYPCICSQVDGHSDNSGSVIKASLVVGIWSKEVEKTVFNR